ncbi:hypothetical protein PILCRDRAFT_819699 [Piloderma croceum F 1598]|uniref:Uncharacterized protein n=1 Tax=Piloderma croceum (strain F 1598) TaxID=765440 RepID=A0A0C3C1G4_PILCF|nr:hypothetical protein PILCRDRAFT_819699 [Piloderma croceum F 1598]
MANLQTSKSSGTSSRTPPFRTLRCQRGCVHDVVAVKNCSTSGSWPYSCWGMVEGSVFYRSFSVRKRRTAIYSSLGYAVVVEIW